MRACTVVVLSALQIRDTSSVMVVIVKKIMHTDVPFYRPALLEQESAGIHPDILTIMKECWTEEPSERPSFADVAKTLKTINKGRSVSAVLFYTPATFPSVTVICLTSTWMQHNSLNGRLGEYSHCLLEVAADHIVNVTKVLLFGD